MSRDLWKITCQGVVIKCQNAHEFYKYDIKTQIHWIQPPSAVNESTNYEQDCYLMALIIYNIQTKQSVNIPICEFIIASDICPENTSTYAIWHSTKKPPLIT